MHVSMINVWKVSSETPAMLDDGAHLPPGEAPPPSSVFKKTSSNQNLSWTVGIVLDKEQWSVAQYLKTKKGVISLYIKRNLSSRSLWNWYQ